MKRQYYQLIRLFKKILIQWRLILLKVLRMLRRLGNIQRILGQRTLALLSYQHCVRLKTKQYYIYYNIGLLLSEMDKKEEALKYLDMSLQYFLKYETLINKGIICLELHRYDECIKIYELAASLTPDCHISYYCKGVALFKLERFTEALTQYNIALKLNPLLINGFNNKSVTLCKLGQINEAITILNQGLKITPADPILILNLIKLYKLNKNTSQVNELIPKIENIQPMWSEYRNLEQMEKAITTAKTELKLLQTNTNNQVLDQQLDSFTSKLDEAYKNLWNYDLELEEGQLNSHENEIEKISELKKQSQNSEEYLIKSQLVNLQNRIYFQSFYWRLLNYIKVAQKIQTTDDKGKLLNCIDQVNQSNQPLLLEEDDPQSIIGSKINTSLHQVNYESQLNSNYTSPLTKFNSAKRKSKIVTILSQSSNRQPSSFSPQPQKAISQSQIQGFPHRSASQFKSQISTIESKPEQRLIKKVKLKPIPITDMVIKQIHEFLGVKSFQDHNILNILKVIANRTKNDSQLQLELQFAAYQMAQGVRERRSKLEFLEKIQQIEKESNKELKYITDSDWLNGIDDTLQVLFYFNDMHRTLIESQSINLRFQIMNNFNIKMKGQLLRKETKKVDTSEQHCTCNIY